MTAVRFSTKLTSVVNITSHNCLLPKTITPRLQPLSSQVRTASFFNDASAQSKPKQPQKNARESWLARKRRERNTRSKISTLAHDDLLSAFQEHTLDSEHLNQQPTSRQKSERSYHNGGWMTSPLIRRISFWLAVLTMPLWGSDIIQVVVPGTIGILILVAGKIKTAVCWTRSAFSSPEK